jgi:hypothetical protein
MHIAARRKINKIVTAMPHAMYHRVPCRWYLAQNPERAVFVAEGRKFNLLRHQVQGPTELVIRSAVAFWPLRASDAQALFSR